MSIKWDDFFVDFSKNRITSETLDLLKDLADEIQFSDAISKYFGGEKINKTEGRAVLHTALRAPQNVKVYHDGENVIPEIFQVKNKIKQFIQPIAIHIENTLNIIEPKKPKNKRQLLNFLS